MVNIIQIHSSNPLNVRTKKIHLILEVGCVTYVVRSIMMANDTAIHLALAYMLMLRHDR